MTSLAATVVGVFLLISFKVAPEPVLLAADPPPTVQPAPTGQALLRPPSPSAPARPSATAVVNGGITGTAIRTIFGDVQVRIVISGGKLIDVQPLQLPRDRARSAFISQYSAPILRSEAIRAQSARIDIVSGATYTSIAYGRSLESALVQTNLR